MSMDEDESFTGSCPTCGQKYHRPRSDADVERVARVLWDAMSASYKATGMQPLPDFDSDAALGRGKATCLEHTRLALKALDDG